MVATRLREGLVMDVIKNGTNGTAGTYGSFPGGDGTNGGNGGNATAANGGNGSDTTNRAIAVGGAGGVGGNGGADNKGSGGSAGNGGNAGSADASTSFSLSSAAGINARSYATGGAGGAGGSPGNYGTAYIVGGGSKGGIGGAATASSNATNNAGYAYAGSNAVGGNGGRAFRAGYTGGAGGIASNSKATASGVSATASIYQRGGAGGNGYGGADGGAGADSTLLDAVAGASTTGPLSLTQTAKGGAGGYAKGGLGGVAGKASSKFTYSALGGSPGSTFTGTATATGGKGGGGLLAQDGGSGDASITLTGAHAVTANAIATGGYGGASSTEGGAGGTATAAATAATTSATATALSNASAYGGRGGNATGVGKYAGNGGVATVTTSLATGFNATAYARQDGGAGGFGYAGAQGGDGASSTLGNTVNAVSSGGTIRMRQLAYGGDGGGSTGSATSQGGDGGNASTTLLFNDYTFNPKHAQTLIGVARAIGGDGGAGAFGGQAGTAAAAINLLGKNNSTTNAVATGGAGGYSGDGQDGVDGGAASATAAAKSYAANKSATTTANATGGAGGNGGGVGQEGGTGGAVTSVLAYAQGFNATATASGTGGRGGTGRNGANGGAGASVALLDTASGVTTGGTLDLTQLAAGGVGGESYKDTGGIGGDASSLLTFNDVATNKIDSSTLFGRSSAFGGAGGGGYHGGAGGNAVASSIMTAFNATRAYSNAAGGAGGNVAFYADESGSFGGNVTGSSSSATSTGFQAAEAESRANGGQGGNADGAARVGGTGGTVLDVTAYASGGNATARVIQSGGNGGNGQNGARGGDGTEGLATNAVSGISKNAQLFLVQRSYGGNGGYSSGARGGDGARGGSYLTFDDTLNATQAATFIGRTYAGGGSGGQGGKGGYGAEGIASTNLSGKNAVRAYSVAIGGAGGSVASGSGDGLDGIYATATAEAVSSSGIAKAISQARGGNGGRARGGGKAGGAGGDQTGSTAHAFGTSAYALVRGYGGSGGGGSYGANGGSGGDSTLVNTVTAESKGGYLRLRQYANGGSGGNSQTQKGGAGGAAQSDLTFNDVTANAIDSNNLSGIVKADGGDSGNGITGAYKGGAGKASVFMTGARLVEAFVTVRGGTGGSGSSGATIDGAAGGTATGKADARTSSATDTAVARVLAYGGSGGYTRAPGQSGGAGGVASGSTAYASGKSANAYVRQVGGLGGNGQYKSSGGDGADSALTNAVSGATGGGTLTLRQTSEGGAGGYGTTGGGKGGAGSASLTFNDDFANLIDASILTGLNIARGGYGGGAAYGKNGGNGGTGTSFLDLTGGRAVIGYGYAYGGAGGYAGGGGTGAGAGGLATTTARSTGAAADATATAFATAQSGAGTNIGSGDATATAITKLGQLASATATAEGSKGQAKAIAKTSTFTIVKDAEATATAQVGSSADSRARANAEGAATSFLGTSFNSYALGTAVPNATFVTTNLNANTTVKAELGGALATVFGTGMHGAFYANDASGLRTYSSTTTWTVNTLTLSGDLILGLLDTQTLGAGFTTLSMTVALDDVTTFTKAFDAIADVDALTKAQAFFDDEVVNLGDVANVEALKVSVSYTLTTGVVGNGFGMNYLLGTTNDEIDVTPPAKPPLPDLVDASDSGPSNSDNVTKVTLPTFAGLTEANATVDLFDGATKVGSVKADLAGKWSITVAAPFTAGVHAMTVKATDAAGNTSVASDPLNVTVDLTPPGAPSTPDLDAASDSGVSTTDNLTNDTTSTFSGTAEALALVELFRGGVTLIGSTFADAAGKWSITSNALPEGAQAITARTTDLAGNVSTASGTLNITVDTVAPATPAAPNLLAGSDSGASSTDDITSDTTPSFNGTTEAGATVTLFVGAKQVGTTTANGAGNWSITSSALADGQHVFTVIATDKAGNAGASSGNLSVIIDTTAPAAPTVLDLAAASDTGASDSDNVTGDSTPTITGKTEANATIELFSGATKIGSAKADGAGVWSITTSALSDGAHTLTATATDLAGNTGAASSALAITVDTIAPAAPSAPNMTVGSDSGASNTDDVTNVAMPVFNGTAEAGATVELFDGATKVGSAKADGTGKWTIKSSALLDGTRTVTAKATDLAGNVSAASAGLVVTIDTTAPAAPTVPDLAAGSDTGVSDTDNVTNDTTPSFNGTAEANATVTLFKGATILGSAKADGGGAWTITLPEIASGVHLITAQATDLAGNVSAKSAELSVTIDTTAPTTPSTPDLLAASDTGVSNTDNITKDTTPTFTGTSDPNSIIKLFNGAIEVASVMSDGAGAWTVTTGDLAVGTHAITAQAMDAAGNTSGASSALSITIDTKAAAPSKLDLAAASDTGASDSDNITNVSTATITGKGEAGATVQVQIGTTVIGTGKVSANGNWAVKTSVLAEGTHLIRARQTDLAGNVSGLGAAGLTVVIDRTAPNTPLITKVGAGTVSGSAEANATVTLLDGATPIGSATADAGGAWSIATVLGAGAHSLTAKATDLAGNASAASSPIATLIGSAGNDVLLGGGANTMLGLAGDDVYLVDNAADTVTEAAGDGFDTVFASVGYALPALSEIEFLIASGGPVTLTGNEFANTLFGSAGDDVLIGAGNADRSFGGAGADRFTFQALSDSTVDPAGQDEILDFDIGSGDLIDLSAIDANSLAAGNQAFLFIGAAAFSNNVRQLRSEVAGGTTVISGDVNGDGAADFAIRLAGAHTLGSGQFIL